MRTIWLATILLCLTSCSSPKDVCSTNADCFAGEVCLSSGVCGVPGAGGADAGDGDEDATRRRDGGPTNNGTTNNGTTNNGTTNNGTTNNGVPDMGDSSMDAADTSGSDQGSATDMANACAVDPFTFVCTDDAMEENDDWISGEQLGGMTLGCNTQFVAVDETYTAVMCPLDGSDWYYVNFVNCREFDYVLEFQLEVLDDCDPEEVLFEPLSFKCDEPNVQCVEVDGKPTIRMIVDGTFQNLQSYYFQVSIGDRNDRTFDYKVRLVVRK